MAVVLEYSEQGVSSQSRLLSPFVVQLLLAYAHANLCWQVSQFMLVSVCSHLYTNFTAWTPLAWLPGDVVAHNLGRIPGLAVMLLFSITAGQMLHGLLVRRFADLTKHPVTLLHDWRTWFTAALWLMWVPVPALYAFAYQFSQWATQRG
jgi:hypothetical protein